MVDGNKKSTTQKVTNTKPLSDTKTIINTSIAAELLGFKTVYLEAGSGAEKNINASIIKKVKKNISVPLLVGGGINNINKAKQAISAGANMLVIGNALEKNVALLKELSLLFKKN